MRESPDLVSSQSSRRKVNLGVVLRGSGLNGLAVRYFGTAEFYMAIFKVFLMLGLIAYTFVTMVGGNPEHWAYGFTYWKNPVSQMHIL